MVSKAQVEVSLKDSTQAGVQSAKRNMDMLAQSVKATAGLFAGISVGAGLKEFSAAILESRLQYEKLNSIMTQAVGANKVGSELEFVRATVSKLGLDFNSTALEYAKFSAAARGTSMEGQQAKEIFTGISMAAAQLGMSADESAGALLAIQQMMSKGKVSAEELRGQLGERLPGAFQIAARAMGMTTTELDKLMSSGELAAGDFLPRFANQLQTEFSGAMDSAADKTQSAINRMTNAWEDFKRVIADGAVGDAAVGMIKNLSVNLENAVSKMRLAQGQATTLYEKLSVFSLPIGPMGIGMGETREKLAAQGQYDEGEKKRMQSRAESGPAARAEALRKIQEADAKATAEQQAKWRAEWDKLAKQYRSSDQKRADSIKEVKDLAAKLGEDPSKMIAGINASGSRGGSGIDKAKREAEQYAKQLQDLKSEINGVDSGFNEQLKMRFDLYSKGQITIDQYRNSVQTLVETQTEAGRVAVQEREEASRQIEALIGANKQREQQAQSYIDMVEPANRYFEKLKEIRDLEDRGMLTRDQSTAARVKITEQIAALDAQKEKVKETDDITRQLGMTFSSAFEDAMVGGKGFRSVLDGLVQDIARMALRLAVIKPLMQMFQGWMGGGSSGAGWTSGYDVPSMRANGGPVQKGVPYIVGERRAELFVPDQNGKILPRVPAMETVSASGGTTINVSATGSASHAEVYNAVQLGMRRAEYEQREREART